MAAAAKKKNLVGNLNTYFFRNFREILRKMGQNLSHFAKNQKRKSGTTLFINILTNNQIQIYNSHLEQKSEFDFIRSTKIYMFMRATWIKENS